MVSEGVTEPQWGKPFLPVFILEKIFKKFSSPELTGQFQSNLIQIILEYMGIRVLQIKDQVFFKGEIIVKVQI
jgi:hypothetical protein